MAISIQNLKDRYTKAHEALDNYGLTISSKLATGNTTKVMLEKFNLMTAWITFLEDKIIQPSEIKGISPKAIILPVPDVDENEDVTIGIENYQGEFVPILTIYNYQFTNDYTGRSINQAQKQNWISNVNAFLASGAINSDEQNTFYKSKKISVSKNATGDVVVKFPATSDYNGQSLFASKNVKNRALFSNITVKGGRTPNVVPKTLSQDLINTYNSVLEDIAIELKFSYTD
jgi:hypothetical protein